MTANQQPQDCFIPLVRDGSVLSVCGVLCIGRTKAGELIKAPDFPKPVDLGGRCLRYRLSEVSLLACMRPRMWRNGSASAMRI